MAKVYRKKYGLKIAKDSIPDRRIRMLLINAEPTAALAWELDYRGECDDMS